MKCPQNANKPNNRLFSYQNLFLLSKTKCILKINYFTCNLPVKGKRAFS